MNDQSFIKRIWVYQKERFPVFQHGLLILIFTFSAASFSRLCRGEELFIDSKTFMVGIITTFLFFFLLRLLDEFKDAEEDAKYRPYRPVPRGLVSFYELKILIAVSIIIIVALNAIFLPLMILAIFVIFLYLIFMTKEFFVPKWLKARPMIYMASHMVIMPFIDIYTTGLDWLNGEIPPSHGVELFLLVSFFNGMVIEIGRKLRAPYEEEKGVQTYSADHGTNKAILIWLAVVTLTFISAIFAALFSTQAILSIILLTLLYPLCLGVAWGFYRSLPEKSGKMIENMSGAWTLGMYLVLGGTPMLVNVFQRFWGG